MILVYFERIGYDLSMKKQILVHCANRAELKTARKAAWLSAGHVKKLGHDVYVVKFKFDTKTMGLDNFLKIYLDLL